MSARRRVVITGLGTVNPLAASVPEYRRQLLAGVNGIAPIKGMDTTHFKVKFGGEVKNFNPAGIVEGRDLRRLDRFSQFALVAAHEAIHDSGLDLTKVDPFRAGVILGSGIGGVIEFEEGVGTLIAKGPGRVSPFVIPKMIANAASGNISIRHGLRGPNTTVTTACSSAATLLVRICLKAFSGVARVLAGSTCMDRPKQARRRIAAGAGGIEN